MQSHSTQIPSFDVIEKRVKVSQHELTILAVRDTNKLLEEIKVDDFNEDERLPYWAEIWPSSIALAEYLWLKDIKDNKILELGCGVGLVGIAAALCGADVLMTDYEEDALRFAKQNVKKNLNQDKSNGKIIVASLDWRTPKLSEKYDFIIGSDLLYEKRNHKPILKLINEYINDNGEAVLTDPNRSTLNSFLKSAEENKFSVQELRSSVEFNEKNFDIATIVLRKK
jgi:predicted nicotinamide N-methyase